jgi:hypothetical protein
MDDQQTDAFDLTLSKGVAQGLVRGANRSSEEAVSGRFFIVRTMLTETTAMCYNSEKPGIFPGSGQHCGASESVMPRLIHEIEAKQLVADVRVGLDELELMKKYQLSRLQLRAAVRRLQAAGFLREPQRPTLVIDAVQFVADLNAGAADGDLMGKYGLNEQTLPSVLDKLVEAGVMDVSLLHERGVAYEGRFPEPLPTESRAAPEHEPASSSEPAAEPDEAVEEAGAPVFPIGVLEAIREDANEVERLLDGGLDVNAVDGQLRRSAVMWAGIYGNVKALRILLERGANVHAVDKHGKTALAHALAREQTEVAEILLNRGAGEGRGLLK